MCRQDGLIVDLSFSGNPVAAHDAARKFDRHAVCLTHRLGQRQDIIIIDSVVREYLPHVRELVENGASRRRADGKIDTIRTKFKQITCLFAAYGGVILFFLHE